MSHYQFYLTPAAGKHLIAKGLLKRPEIRDALKNGTVLVIAGTTNVYAANALLEAVGSDVRVTFPAFHKGVTVAPGAKTTVQPFPGQLVIEKGQPRFVDDLGAACDALQHGDVILKGANALDLKARTAAILIGNNEMGGTIMEASRPVLARRVKLILPVGVEKRVDLPLSELTARLNAPDGHGLRLFEAPGEAFTELDAIRLLTGCEAVIVSSGGVNGGEGGVYLDASEAADGTGDIDALKALIREIAKEPLTFV